MCSRADFPRNSLSFVPKSIIVSQAVASASGSLGGTTFPVLPIINAESPMSVATQGMPQAIASPITIGKASPKAEDVENMSNDAARRGISSRRPNR